MTHSLTQNVAHVLAAAERPLTVDEILAEPQRQPGRAFPAGRPRRGADVGGGGGVGGAGVAGAGASLIRRETEADAFRRAVLVAHSAW